MVTNYDKPEGLMGVLLAFEGMNDAETILNGPTGCKFHPASVAEAASQRKGSFNPLVFSGEFHFCQPRIPCTYLGGYDYIVGSGDRLQRLFAELEKIKPSLIGIVNSPGASLIGESLNVTENTIPVIKVETPGYSQSMGEGFQEGIISILEKIPPQTGKKQAAVNLIGLSIWHLNWEDSLDDLKYLLRLCDIEVIATVGAGWSLADLKASGEAELNVVLHREFGSRIAELYAEHCATPFIAPEIPLGFDSLERWIKAICSRLAKDPTPALELIKSKRKRVFRELQSMEERKILPKGRTFSLAADESLALPIIKFLYEYLGMVPVAVTIENPTGETEKYLQTQQLTVSNNVWQTTADLFLGDGNTISTLLFQELVRSGIAVVSPGLRQVAIQAEPVLGLGGTLRLLDGVLNALVR